MPKIVIEKSGEMRFIYSDKLIPLIKQGNPEIKRATHVEWEKREFGDGWYVDMSPVDGPKFGPFETREEALQEEHDCLENMGIPFPGDLE